MKRPRTSREFCAAFERACVAKRQRGSHIVYTMPDGRAIPVPAHNGRGKDLSTGLRCRLIKELIGYGLLAALVLGVISWIA